MRMWMVDPELMCRQHLLGEHNEIHMLVGCIIKGKNIKGYIDKGLVSPLDIASRHLMLRDEMLRRGYNHKSEIPIGFVDRVYPDVYAPFTYMIDEQKSATELRTRCNECRV